MARVALSDDGRGRYAVSTIGENGVFGSVPVALDDDTCASNVCGVVTPPGGGGGGTDPETPGGLPTISVRGRIATGYDADGNQTWEWRTLVTDAPSIQYVERKEWSDAAAQSVLTARVTFLYSDLATRIRETATAMTSNGRLWRVYRVEEAPGRVTLHMTYLEDGEG